MHDLIERQAAIDALTRFITPHDNGDGTMTVGVLSKSSITDILNDLPSAQPETHEERTETHACDCISRQAAIDAVGNMLRRKFGVGGDLAEITIAGLPSAQPEKRTDKCTETHACDYINRKDAIDAHYEYCNKHPDAGFPVWSLKILEDLPSAQPEHTNNRVIKQTLDEVYAHAETEAEARFHAQQRWIPCSERLPENGHYYLWCSDMGSVQSDYYWDGFENGMKYGYNIVAWMPLPEPYAERRTDDLQ